MQSFTIYPVFIAKFLVIVVPSIHNVVLQVLNLDGETLDWWRFDRHDLVEMTVLQ